MYVCPSHAGMYTGSQLYNTKFHYDLLHQRKDASYHTIKQEARLSQTDETKRILAFALSCNNTNLYQTLYTTLKSVVKFVNQIVRIVIQDNIFQYSPRR